MPRCRNLIFRPIGLWELGFLFFFLEEFMSLRISNLIHSGWLEREFIKIMSTCLLHVTHNFWMQKTIGMQSEGLARCCDCMKELLVTWSEHYSDLLAYSIFASSTLQKSSSYYTYRPRFWHIPCATSYVLCFTISVFTLLMNFGFVLWTEMGRKEATDQLEITLTMEVVGWLKLL